MSITPSNKTFRASPVARQPLPGSSSAQARTFKQMLSNSNKSVLLFSLLIAFAVIYTLYLTKTLLLPIIVAFFLSIFFAPIVSRLKRVGVPRALSSVSIIASLLLSLALVGSSVVPAGQDLLEQIPQVLNEVDETVAAMSEKMDVKPSPSVGEDAGTVSDKAVSFVAYEFFLSAPVLVVQLVSIIFLFHFILSFGPVLFTKIMDNIACKETRASIEESILGIRQIVTKYILVISVINFSLGLTLGFILWLAGVENYLLWGMTAFLMNYIQYLGPLITATALALGVYVEFGGVDAALMALGLYMLLNLIESQIVTPIALGSNLKLNPLLLFLWLMIWGWIWGAAGMLICVPLLVCLRIVITSLFPDNHWLEVAGAR